LPEDLGVIPDIVAHFAAGTGSLDRPIDELRELNVKMTMKILEDARKAGAQRFLWPTTSLALAVPDSPYVQSKEEAFQELRREQTAAPQDAVMKIICCRFFNVAGAYKGLTERRRNEVHLVPIIADCFVQHRPLGIQGTDYDTIDGTPSRDFVNVVDVADYLLDMATGSTQPYVSERDGAIWLGTGRTTTVKQAVSVFEQHVGWSGALSTEALGRRPFDTGVICCPEENVRVLEQWRSLVPAWVSIRDEAETLVRAPA
jgi:UDP-glucose 4-epimerase